MNSSIFKKSILAYLIVALLSFLGVAIISYRIDFSKQLDDTSKDMYAEAVDIARSYGTQYYSSKRNIEDTLRQLTIVSKLTNTRIMFINSDDTIILDTDSNSHINTHPVMLQDFDPAANGNKLYFTGNFYGIFDEEYFTVTYPITYNLAVRGYVAVHMPVSYINEKINKTFNTNYISLIICLACTLIFLLTIFLEVHKPLKAVSKGVDEYGKGNLSYRITKYKNDEIGRLAVSLNYMAEKIDESEHYERAFIANVSHDFRSPLTSIKGYLEAILDGTIPHEMQDKYLKIIISETDRLTKLTNNILTLNNMETRNGHLNISAFDINSVIKSTLDTFEGTCKTKNIKFALEFVDEAIIVKADIDKITQVLYNLIDNAIKFSNPNSYITIKVSERGEKAYVSVKDTGIGIPADAIGKIWDRFYKTDLSRGKDKKGTGLGLSIVKEIIKKHNENIDVISTEQAGTEFIFSLTLENKTSLLNLTKE